MSVAVDEETFWLGDWKVEPTLNRIVRGEEIVRIDPRNMKVLQLLASKPGEVFSQAEIEESVWSDVIVTPNSVYQSIAQLRRALGDEKDNPKYIETIARRGYRLVVIVTRSQQNLLGNDAQTVSETRHQHRVALTGRSLVVAIAFSLAVTLLSLSGAYKASDTSDAQTRHEKEADAYNGSRRSSARELLNLSIVTMSRGKHEDALKQLQDALDIERKRVGSKHPSTGLILTALANAYVWAADYESAEAAAREAIAAFEGTSNTHPGRAEAIRYLGYVLLEAGKYGGADQYLTEALNLHIRIFGESSKEAATTLANLADLRYAQGRFNDAETFARQAVEILEQVTTEELLISRATSSLVFVLLRQQRYREAKERIENSLKMLHGAWNDDHPYIIATRDLLGKALLGLGEFAAAEDVFRRNIDLWSSSNGWDHRVAGSTSALGEALLGQGRIAEAERYLLQASLDIEPGPQGREEQARYREHAERLRRLRGAKAERSGGMAEANEVTSS